MANNCYNIITLEGDMEILNKIKDIITPLTQSGLNYENYKEIFNNEQVFIDFYEDYDFRDEHPKWFTPEEPFISEGQLIIQGDSAWSPVTELTGIISHVYKVFARITYEEQGMNFAGEQIYNEDGVCTLDDEYTYWEWQFKEGNFYDEFDFSAEYMDDLDEFLDINNLTNKVDMDKVMKIWNEYHKDEENKSEDDTNA
jgi:hypothetical protein